jgi:hypothetical protein
MELGLDDQALLSFEKSESFGYQGLAGGMDRSLPAARCQKAAADAGAGARDRRSRNPAQVAVVVPTPVPTLPTPTPVVVALVVPTRSASAAVSPAAVSEPPEGALRPSAGTRSG